MEPCPYAKLIIESLALKLPKVGPLSSSTTGVHPITTPFYCHVTLNNNNNNNHFPTQTLILPLSNSSEPEPASSGSSVFHLDPPKMSARPVSIRVSVYTGCMGRSCGVRSGKLLGRVNVGVELDGAEVRPSVLHCGWVKIGRVREKGELYVVVRSEPDPRFVFQFGGEPECSPVVFQIQGNIRQPVFSCKFSADRNSRSRSLPTNFTPTNNNHRGWIARSLSGDKEKPARERKGWMIMTYDLSGSPVAAASVITPFVPSPGTDRVLRSNPGAWLILRPHGSHVSSWKPWGRLEAWRERGPVDGLGYKFELVTENGPTRTGIPIAEATINMKKGGRFTIDQGESRPGMGPTRWPVRGFVMGSTVEGEGKVSKPLVEVGAKHVTCMADAALFITLSAAVDLSMDACRLFSHKLRKELCHDDQHDQL